MIDISILKKHVSELVDMEESEFESIAAYFQPVYRKKHQFLVQSGYDVGYEYFVVKGCIKSSVLDEYGKEHIVQFAMENWWITDYYAFVHQEKARMNIDCLEDCELLAISYQDRKTICKTSHNMEHFWATKTKYGYAALQNRILGLIKDSAKVRYENLIQQYPTLIQRVPKKYIASFLGVSRETLSRLY